MNDQQKETVELPQRYWLIIFTYILVQMSPFFGMDLFESVFPNMESVDHFVYWHLFSYTIAALVMLYLVQEDMKPSNMRDREGIGKLIGWSIGGVFIAFGAQYLANIINFQFIGIDKLLKIRWISSVLLRRITGLLLYQLYSHHFSKN